LKKTILPFSIATILLIADQLLKKLVASRFIIGDTFPLIPYVLEFFYLHNDGAAMGIFSGLRWPLILVTALVIIVCIVYLLIGKCESNILRYGLCLIVSGGIGNLIDRIQLGYVIDYVRFPITWFHYSFNLADCAVCVGAGLIVLDLLLDIFKSKSQGSDSAL
jgi:signal peptidase II